MANRTDTSHRRTGASRPGLREVAARSGVAVSSVSRVLSGHPDVSEVMHNRVMDAVAALGYQPDRLARSLRTGSTTTVGFVVGDISNQLMSEIALGAEVRLREAGYSTLLTNSLNEPSLDVQHIGLLRQRRVDGLLLSVNDETDRDLAAALAESDIPSVLIDRHVDGLSLSAVLSDHASGMDAAIEHLHDLGHRRIALIAGNPRIRPSRERATQLQLVCDRHPEMTGVVLAAASTPEHGYQATRQLLDESDSPTAIVSGSNQVLGGVLQALGEHRLAVPKDISLISCDDVPISQFFDPPLSTISRVPYEMGTTAAELLLEALKDVPSRSVLLPTAFHATASCAPPAR